MTWLLQEVPLRSTAQAPDTGQVYAIPTARTSLDEIERALAALAGRESRIRIYERLAARAALLSRLAGGLLDDDPGEPMLAGAARP